jgi:hypothetical protein
MEEIDNPLYEPPYEKYGREERRAEKRKFEKTIKTKYKGKSNPFKK